MRKDGVLTYLHSDYLGSTVYTTDSAGNGTAQGYYAYGRYRLGGTLPTDQKFTSQKLDATGLYYYNARYYDPHLGTFISPDTIVPDPGNLFDYNRYMYARGNPLKYNDPSGHCVTNEQEITRGDAFDCTVDEMSALTWEARKWWLQKFMADNDANWFHNVLGILDYFANEPQFASLNGWASYSDAGVLVAIQDGWRQSTGQVAIDQRSVALVASGEWKKFFTLKASRGEDDSQVRSQWGIAEQAGVDFGLAIAAPYQQGVDSLTASKIDTFVGFGNFYRGMVTNEVWNLEVWNLPVGSLVDPYLDPRTSQARDFVNNISNYVISPIAAALWGGYQAGASPHPR